jgi:hypothetical protein
MMKLEVIGQFVILSFGVLGYQMGVMVNAVLECKTGLAAESGTTRRQEVVVVAPEVFPVVCGNGRRPGRMTFRS